MSEQLPDNFQPVQSEEKFSFSCHPGVDCFTECCRELDLALTPYDVLRLKNRLQMHSGAFLEKYVIIAWEEGQIFPTCYLTMVDDGRASCVFVEKTGCTVYSDRPSACRAYPVGRGARRGENGTREELFVLIREPHCRGFKEAATQTPPQYFADQKLEAYNQANDAILPLLQHERIRQGFRPDKAQLHQFILALYNLDMFRQEMADGRISMNRPLNAMELQALSGDDEQLLLLGVRWLLQEFFNE
jgi:Fe-S-cluster containining protein